MSDDEKDDNKPVSREAQQMASVTSGGSGKQVATKPGMSLAFLEAAVKKKRAEQAALRPVVDEGAAPLDPLLVEEVSRELDVKMGEAETLLRQHGGDPLAVFIARINSTTPKK
jgi:hypothetical protein